MQPGWCQPVRQEFMENECEALPGVAYSGVRDNRSTLNTKTGYDDDDDDLISGHRQKTFYEVIKSQNEHIGEASVLYNEQRWQRTLVLGVN